MKIIKAILAIALFYAMTLLTSVNFIFEKIVGVQLLYNLILVCIFLFSIITIFSFEKYFKRNFKKRLAYLMISLIIMLVTVFTLIFYYCFNLFFKFDVEVWPMYWLLIIPSVYLIVFFFDVLEMASKDPR